MLKPFSPTSSRSISLLKHWRLNSISNQASVQWNAVSSPQDAIETGDHYYPKLELVRLTFPRRVYTQAHCDVTVEAVDEVFNRRESIKGMKMIYEPKYLRFFQARFEWL
jgi:tryptophanase